MVKLTVLAAAISTLVSGVAAAFSVTSPGPDRWWVANSQNLVSWTCKDSPPAQTFTILIKDPKQASAQAIVSIAQNADCSRMLATGEVSSFSVQTGYTLQLANTLNNSQVYAESQPFEIKAVGSAYPPQSSPVASATGSASGSAAAAAASASQSGRNGAVGLQSAGIWAALAGVLIGVIA